jgi:hypothetical protein
MKHGTRDLLFIVAGLLLSTVTLWAGGGYDARLGRDIAYLNGIGRTPDREKSLERDLTVTFRTEASRVDELRKQRLGPGDIAAAFAVASRLKGGISEVNLQRIVRQWKTGHSGWASIARSFGVRLRAVVLKIETVTATRTASASPGHSPTAVTQPRARSYDTLNSLLHHG